MQSLPPEARPAPHPWPDWGNYTAALTARLARANLPATELVFIGDSLVAGWSPEVFAQFYGTRRALNLGIPGDTTQTLLWRIQRGNWPAALRPRVVVVQIGSNNTEIAWPAEGTAAAILRVVEEIRARAPGVRVVVMGLLPRGTEPSDPRRAILERVNELLRGCADGRSLFVVEAGTLLLDGNQRLTPLISFDQTHLTAYGYTILSTALEGTLRMALEAR